MKRQPAVKLSDVKEALSSIKEKGLKPSVLEVYRTIGRGSLSTIQKHYREINGMDEVNLPELHEVLEVVDRLEKKHVFYQETIRQLKSQIEAQNEDFQKLIKVYGVPPSFPKGETT